MNKNFNYDDTLIEPANNHNDSTGDTTRIDTGATPPPYTPEAATEEYATEEQPQQSERKDSNSNKGIIAASAGIALIGGAAAAYGLGAFDSESDDDPNAIADAVADDAIELSEEVADVASIEVVTSIGSDSNVRSLGTSITIPGSLDEISLTTTVTDDMSFSTAFATARRAVGPHGVFEWRGGVYGTYYENEWKCMPADYKREFSNHNWRAEMSDMEPGETVINNQIAIGGAEANGGINITNDITINNIDGSHGASHSTGGHATTGGGEISGIEYTVDDVFISTAPNDKMDFPTAYSVARADVGPGGVFGWRGGTYNTFTQEEWRNLSDASKSTFTHYDWSDEIDKAESQGNEWVNIYVDPETGEPLAEIPTDPVTGEPIDGINPHDSEIAQVDYEGNLVAENVNDNPENFDGEGNHFVNDNPENNSGEREYYAQATDDNNEFVNDNPENFDGEEYYAQVNEDNNEFVNDNPEAFDGEGYYAQVNEDNNEFVNDNPEAFDGEEYYAQVNYDNNEFVNDSPENFDSGEEYYAQVSGDNDYEEPVGGYDYNDNPENFDSGEEYIAAAYEDVEVLNGDVDYYVAESADYGYGSPAVIEDDYSVAEVSSYDDSYDYNDNPEPSYEPEPSYDSNYDMPADDYSDDSVDIDGVC